MGFQISPAKCGRGHNKWSSGLAPGMIKYRRVPCDLFLDKELHIQSSSFFPVC